MLLSDGNVLAAATTAERFFRIDQAQEHLHYATDIFSEELFIVYPEANVEAEATSSDVTVLRDQHESHVDRSSLATQETLLMAGGAARSSGHRVLHRVNAQHNVSPTSRRSTQ